MKLEEKLQGIQSELNVPKSRRNDFGKYNYRSCEDILNALKPLMEKFKVFLTIEDEIVQIGERFYIKATAALHDAETEATADKITAFYATGFAREEDSKKGMDASQLTGSTSSYARKYALCGLFAIDDGIDSDKTNAKTCAICKKVIEGTDKLTGAQIAAASKKKFRKELCIECAQKQKEAKEKKDAK